MEDCKAKLAHKLVEMCAGVAAQYVSDRDNNDTDAEFWGLWNAANGASARLGLPYHETPIRRPSGLAIDKWLAEVVRKGGADA